ncbi:MAG: methyl-accepting chemotaxis protein [Muribaculaceae bacterium]|nr:methyl-accepting chemotaxis protein [Roseburia sp.]MCM1431197.1 methyl-accepting chemotaxis protein [Muribaculaceae bacterium]MCM1492317.1 methyl-accepting chemotaxis protein [Muribaculaceae bacterium]
MNERLEKLVSELPLIQQLFEQEVYITVIDREGIVSGFVVPEGVSPQLKVGERFVDPSGAFQKVIDSGRARKNQLPKEVMGEPFEGMVVPIKDGTEVVGCITCSYSADVREQNREIASRFQESVHNVRGSVETIVSGIEGLSRMLTEVNEVTSSVESDVNAATEVVGKISGNASRSNILALNASIEAARSGEYGRGFAVVADQMGKLANDSGSSATEIKATLSDIAVHLGSIVDSIKDATDAAQEHMDNMEMIKNTLNETIQLAEQLEKNVNI